MIALVDRVRNVMDRMFQVFDNANDEIFFPEIHTKVPRVREAYTDSQGHPVLVLEFDSKSVMRNHMNATHGGALTTVLDWYSSLSVIADERYWSRKDEMPSDDEIVACLRDMGLSRSLKSQFMRPVPVDDTVYVECRVLSNGKKTSCIAVTIFDKNGKALFEGLHDKIKLYKPISSKI